ncbi:hypothetical protein TNCV_409741 [Trichonephila clavipes]|nr:hypothetical protein TNCV_409741 [Trichonephila clavipes]
MPALTWQCRAAYSIALGFSGSITGTTVLEMCSEKASMGSIGLIDERQLMKSVETNLAFLLFRKDVGGATRSQPCSRVKNGIDAFVEDCTHALHGNPTMTLRLVAK